jgi:hypothetical protein
MIIDKEFYNEIYFIEEPELLTEAEENNLIMCGTKNFYRYYLPFKTKKKFELIKNVELIEFSSEDSMFSYIKELNPVLLLNFSLEHDNPCLLRLL